MKKLAFILSLFLIPFLGFSAHIVGGEIYYDCLGNNNYRVTIDLYRDCNSSGAAYDSPLVLAIYNSSGSLVRTENVTFPGASVLPIEFENPCVSAPNNICTQRAIYTKVINLPPIPGGYTLSYQRCCRGPSVINLVNPDEAGLTLTTHIPGTETGIDCNSSPRFTNYPPLALCNDYLLEFDHSATDPDGDSLSYELCTPFHGGTSAQPLPSPPSPPPYVDVQWANNFSMLEPMGTGSGTAINPTTGEFTTTPQFIGKYAVGICVKEWRNGVLVGETRRDFLFQVINCDIALQARITPQAEAPTFTSYCQGLTITFDNTSFGGTNYEWDFGINGTDEDKSTQFEPTYTFPSPGTYEVTLVVNPGWPCTDTSVQEFNIFNELDISFDPPDPQCITGNSYDFEVDSGLFSNINWEWKFGENGEFGTSTSPTPQGIQFNQSGYIPVTVSANFEQCDDEITDSIFVFPEPEVKFFVEPGLKCAPFQTQFIDSSTSATPISYIWDFGDNTELSDEQNPTHTYLNPGTYNPFLTIKTDSGCIRTLIAPAQTITVHPSPTSEFTASPYEVDVFNPFIDFEDFSTDSEVHAYFFGDGDSTQIRSLTHTYDMSGYIYPMQVVWNEFGCPDTSVQEIFIRPITTIYVPNAFTPDGDGINDVWKPIIRDVIDYELTVYDRWGQAILNTNDPNYEWNGTVRGKMARDGVFTYVIHYRGYNKTGFDYVRGHFSLLR